MSEPGEPRSTPSSGLSVLMLVVGIILVLPGLCSGFFAVVTIGSPSGPYRSALIGLWLICFTVAGVSVVLIAWAVRRLQRAR
jgi:hypothetical protein